MPKIEIDSISTLSLESQMERLALEANVLTNLIDNFRNVIPALSDRISKALDFKSEAHNSHDVLQMTKTYKSLSEKLPYVNYVDYTKTVVSVPESFQGDMLEYVKLLNKITPEVYVQVKVVLVEYKTLLSVFITNKDNKNSLQDDTKFFKKVEDHRLATLRSIDAYHPTDTDRSKSYLGDVIGRFSDIGDLVKETSSLDSKHGSQNIREIESLVRECVELLNIITNSVTEGDITKVSGATSMNLASGAYEVARYVEFLSMFRFKTMQAIQSSVKLVNQLHDIIK